MARLWTPMSILIRLSLYYILYLLIWGCPINVDLKPDSPTGCRQIHLCVDRIRPVISSQYQAYVEPRVKEFSPYFTKSQKVYSDYARPVVSASSKTYKRFGHPYVKSASKSATLVYKTHIQPVLHSWGAKAQNQYNIYLAHHVDSGRKVFESSVQQPALHYLQLSKRAYDANVAPRIKQFEPYVVKGFANSIECTRTHVIPAVYVSVEKTQYYVHLAYVKLITFYLETVYPKTILFYQHHVEPQFLKIQNRIFNPQESSSLSSIKSSFSTTPTSTSIVVASSTISQVTEQQTISSTTAADDVADSIKNDMKHMQKQIKELTESAKEDVAREFDQLVQAKLIATSEAARAAVKDFNQQTEQLLSQLETNAENIDNEEEFNHLRTDIALKIRDLALGTKARSKELVISFSTEAQQIKYSVWESLSEVANIALKQLAEKWTWTEGVKWEDWKGYHSLKRFVADAEETVIGLDLDLSPIDNIGDEVNNAVNLETTKVIERIEAVKQSWHERFPEKAATGDANEDVSDEQQHGSSILSESDEAQSATTKQEIPSGSTSEEENRSTEASQDRQNHISGNSQDDEQMVIKNEDVELPIPEPTEEGLIEEDQVEDLMEENQSEDLIEEDLQDEQVIEIEDEDEEPETITSRIIRTVYVPNKSSSAEGTIPSGEDERYTGDVIEDLSVSTFTTA